MHDNSIEAYENLKPKLGERAERILRWMESKPTPMTDREVKDQMGFGDMNEVRPRITELVKHKLLHEVGKRKCPATNKTVRLVLHNQQNQMELF